MYSRGNWHKVVTKTITKTVYPE